LTTLYVLMVAIDQHLIAGRAPIFNQTFGGFAFLIAALICAVWFYSRSEDREVPERALLIPVILVAANILAIIAFSLEAHDYFEDTIRRTHAIDEKLRDLQLAQQLSLSVVWTIYGGAMLVVGIWRRNRLLRVM